MPNIRKIAKEGTRFTTAYVPAPVCAPSRSCLAAGREYDYAGVLNNFDNDYPVNQTTFYKAIRESGYHVLASGKDDLTKATYLGLTSNYSGCPDCKEGDGKYHLKQLGFSDAKRYAGKLDVVHFENPYEMYGYYLHNNSVTMHDGSVITAWEAHRSCMGKSADATECQNSTFTAKLYVFIDLKYITTKQANLPNERPHIHIYIR